MMKKARPDVHPDQVWRDRDPRMLSGNRRVRVTRVVRQGDIVTVHYQSIHARRNELFDQTFKSRYERFQRAFDLIQPAGAVDGGPVESSGAVEPSKP